MKRFCATTWTLFKKDLKDTLRNANMMIMLVLPPLFCVVFKFMSIVDMGELYLLMLTTVMTVCMVPISFLATIIAEEKEKNTLRTLMLTGVSAGEFLTSKMVLTWLLMSVVNTVDFFLIGYSVTGLPAFLLITTLGSLSLLLLGAVIGIFSRDQMSTSVLSVPLMMLMLFPSLIGLMSPLFAKIAEISPVEHMMRLFNIWDTGGSVFTGNGRKALIVMFAWVALGLVAYLLTYRKKRLDD